MVVEQTLSLEKVFEETERITLYAEPLLGRINSPWLPLEKGIMKKLKKAIGKAAYSAHEGGGFTPRGILITEILDQSEKYVTLKNASGWRGAKKKIETEIIRKVKKEVVYPVFFGREIDKWKISPKGMYFVILLYDCSTGKMLREDFVKINFPEAYAYYDYFKETLVKAANYKQYGKGKPWYFVHRMGKQIFSPFKVVWGEVGTQINAAVVTGASTFNKRVLIPDYTCVYIPLDDEDEAHYVCALLNSTISRLVTSYIHLHPDPHVLEYIKIQKYNQDNFLHRKLVDLSANIHRAAAKNDKDRLPKIEEEIDVIVAQLYDLSSKELENLKK